MKKLWILKAVAGIFVTYGIIGFFGVPYAIKNSVPQKVFEATKGGDFSIESASFNPFTFHLQVHDMAFKTPKKGDFIRIDYFAINLNPFDYLWKFAWVVEDIRIEKPQITLHKGADGEMNFGWLSALGTDENKTTEESKPFALLLNNFTLKGGGVTYTDKSEGKHFHHAVDSIGFHLENIDLRDASEKNGIMRLYATINEGGFIDLRGKIERIKPFAMEGSVGFNSGKLHTPWRYFKDKLPIEVADGIASFGLNYALNTDDINATKLSKVHVELNRLRIIPKGQQQKLLDLRSFKLSGANVWPMRKVLEANTAKLDGLAVSASRSKGGVIDWIDYIDQIKKAFPDDENETKIPWSFRIKDVAAEEIALVWNDYAPKEAYRASVGGISLYSQNLSSNPKELVNAAVHFGAFELNRLGDSRVVAGFEDINANGIVLNRDAKHATVKTLEITGANTSLKRLKNGTIDLQKLMFASVKKEPVSDTAPWSYVIDEIFLNNGGINFTDEVPSRNVEANIDKLQIKLNGVSSNPKTAIDIESSGRINQKTMLKLHAQAIRETLKSKGIFELSHFSLPLIDPYIEPSTYASLRRGDLTLKGEYSYTPKETSVKGKIALADWVVEDRRDNSVLLGWNRIGVTPFVYAYPENRLKINQISVNGLYTNALIDQNKTLNYSTLSKAKKSEANTTKEKSNPFGIDVVKLAIVNSSATFSDLSLPLPFKTYIHDLKGEVLGISTTKDVNTFVRLKGGVDQYGSANIDGKLNTNAPKSFTDMQVVFENLELKQYTPYSLQFLGYKIANGKLFLNLGYKINDGKLDGKNQVVIKQIELGEEKAGGSPWPMRLVVALLEDGEGVIDIDLPIQGDVNSPDFKYGKVVWQVIGNLLTKAVTAPFKLLGSLMGISSDDDTLSNVSFEPGEYELTPPVREQLDKLATVLAKRPKLSLKIHGGWAAKEDDRALKIQKLIRSVMGVDSKEKADSMDVMSLEMVEKTAKKSMEASEVKAMRAQMEKKYVQEAEFVRHYTEALVERLILLQVIAPPEMGALATARANAIAQYLSKNTALSGRVSVSVSEKAVADAKEKVPSRLEITVQ
ncbi:MAG: DUF748 domain-containing protein [Epsilonproteobacteria bacterium]|nr:DUF748 domain-containing protein [Campylobacterota bacterium]